MEVLSFDSFEAAEAKLNSLELGEIEEATWQHQTCNSRDGTLPPTCSELWDSGRVAALSLRTVCLNPQSWSWNICWRQTVMFCAMWSGRFRCYLSLLLPWWRCGVGTRGQEDFSSFLQDATKEPEKFELSESDEIKALWIWSTDSEWLWMIHETFHALSTWCLDHFQVKGSWLDVILRLIVSWQMLTDIDRCW